MQGSRAGLRNDTPPPTIMCSATQPAAPLASSACACVAPAGAINRVRQGGRRGASRLLHATMMCCGCVPLHPSLYRARSRSNCQLDKRDAPAVRGRQAHAAHMARYMKQGLSESAAAKPNARRCTHTAHTAQHATHPQLTAVLLESALEAGAPSLQACLARAIRPAKRRLQLLHPAGTHARKQPRAQPSTAAPAGGLLLQCQQPCMGSKLAWQTQLPATLHHFRQLQCPPGAQVQQQRTAPCCRHKHAHATQGRPEQRGTPYSGTHVHARHALRGSEQRAHTCCQSQRELNAVKQAGCTRESAHTRANERTNIPQASTMSTAQCITPHACTGRPRTHTKAHGMHGLCSPQVLWSRRRLGKQSSWTQRSAAACNASAHAQCPAASRAAACSGACSSEPALPPHWWLCHCSCCAVREPLVTSAPRTATRPPPPPLRREGRAMQRSFAGAAARLHHTPIVPS